MTDAPAPELVAPGVWVVRVPMAVQHNPVALCYLIEDAGGGVHMVDGGITTPESRAIVQAALEVVGGSVANLRSLTLSHFHGDHLGFVEGAQAAGARIAMHRLDIEAAADGHRGAVESELERWGMPADEAAVLLALRYPAVPHIPVDLVLEDGDRLDIPGVQAHVVHTPGHTDGSICVVLPDARVFFTGDHVLPDQFPGVGLGNRSGRNPLHDYNDSLERVLEYDGYQVLPGHGWVFDTLGERVAETLSRHGRRTQEVAQVLLENPDATVWQTVSQLSWRAGWDGLIGFYRLSALRQTEWHMQIVGQRG